MLLSDQKLIELQLQSGMSHITDLQTLVKKDKVLVYIMVDWSGPERISRNVCFTAISNLKIRNGIIIEPDKYPIFEQWYRKQNFVPGGYGELLWVKNGNIIDYLKFPGNLGIESTKDKISSWIT